MSQKILDFRKDNTYELAGINTDELKGKFIQIRNGKDNLTLLLTDEQWFFISSMFFEELSEEEQKQIASQYFDI